MKRREILAGAGALALTGCAGEQQECDADTAGRSYTWKMVTTWPPNFPGLGTGVLRLAKFIEEASDGRLRIKVYAAGELVPAFEAFDTVSRGTAEIGHGAAYYWKGKSEAAQFFTAMPFGMNALEMNGWLYYGGGLVLYRELYAGFNLVPFPAGNTGVQMGGWFNKEINSLADLDGLKMRIPGWGGEVLKRAGGTPVNLPGAEIFTALQTGSIDASEWVGPYNDVAFGLHKAARYYYYPGWHEPGPVLECIVNRQAWEALPKDLQTIVELACSAINDQMTAEFTARNAQSLQQLKDEGEVELRPFPDDVMNQLRNLTDEVIADLVARDPVAARIYESFSSFRKTVAAWTEISEQAMLDSRSL
ncbi:MAG: TRAP transporter substrate-binding protein [Gammaproteobacteria bacterium]|nr:ABC transporter substrate-binding protein [Chromatiales bacterium]MCP4924450.1 TRAP transporter substrate-binding protein [Gammaproteobacteria bacterium]MDP7153731.1 TRAP transporter substrate-binding protein [Gammaproteobacteria bacterium]MDP7296750.1 TRAP transporter substrate-binding protein [Gammaproteobacteria bacterium]MDP7419194.1 TRAP transporter substrate-binding protein [Gammaproteobacteria bacterium]